MKSTVRFRPLFALAALLLACPPAAAQYDDAYDDDGIRQTVARISWFEGEVSFHRGDDPDDWQLASINYPMAPGDRLWAASDARAELQLRGTTVFLGPESELTALDLTRDVRQLSLTLGTASFRINRIERDEVFEVATPNVSVTFETPGSYRVDVDEDGNSRVSVYQGRAWAAAAGGQIALDRGDQVLVRGLDRPGFGAVALARADSWDRWVEERARRYRSVRSASYVHPDIYGGDDLDAYGFWESSPEYGFVWYPRGVAAGWEPYRLGRWIWRDPWGWTWLSSEPWGWAPYHYGRWAVVRGRWCWVPVGPGSRYPGYAPAIVGFVGGGPGWSVSFSAGGFVGWFPLAPREPFDPWWYHARTRPNLSGFHYAYRGRVTVVARDVFVRGGRVDRDLVRDARIVREVATAPVLRGPIPVLPTRESIRVSPVGERGRSEVRPPERIGRREVVTRTAPPPAPPTFDRKLAVIRETGGEPVPTDVSRRLSAEEHRGERGGQPVRSAEPAWSTPGPSRVEVPDRRPPREGPNEPRTGWQVGTTPTRPAPTPRSGRYALPSRPAPAPTAVRREAPRLEPQVTAPRRDEVREAPEPKPARPEPQRVQSKRTDQEKAVPKATPAPKRPPERREEVPEPGKRDG